MIYYVDIDNTITYTFMSEYFSAVPRPDRIEKINKMYEDGHTIVYYTARGMASGKDFKEFTEHQLKQWGCKFHEIKMGKPSFDLLIDDKSIHPDEFFN